MLFAASLAPGFVYIRIAERRRPRANRSSLAEAVEMVVFGAGLSLVCAFVVLLIATATDLVNWEALVTKPRDYVADYPIRFAVPVMAVLAMSYALAALLALAVHRSPAVSHPGVTVWQQAFWHDKPEDSDAFATIVLRDGTEITGIVRAFTQQMADNRELLLAGPFARARPGDRGPVQVEEDFLVVREDDVSLIQGHYWLTSDQERRIASDSASPGSRSAGPPRSNLG